MRRVLLCSSLFALLCGGVALAQPGKVTEVKVVLPPDLMIEDLQQTVIPLEVGQIWLGDQEHVFRCGGISLRCLVDVDDRKEYVSFPMEYDPLEDRSAGRYFVDGRAFELQLVRIRH